MTRRRTVEDWRREVFRSKLIGDPTRVVLLAMAEYMRTNRQVSVPRKAIAAMVNRTERRVTERITDAHRAGFLSTVSAGYRGHTAVYEGLFPTAVDISKRGTAHSPLSVTESGTATSPLSGAETRPLSTGESGPPGGPTISKASPSRGLGFTGGSKDESGAPRLRLPAADCQWHRDDTCPPDCANAAKPSADRRWSA